MMTPALGLDLQEYDLVCRARDGGEALYALAALIGRMYLADGGDGDKQLLGGIAATLRILGSAELQLAHEWEELRHERSRRSYAGTARRRCCVTAAQRGVEIPQFEDGRLEPPSELPASAILMAREATRCSSYAELAGRLDVAPSHISRVIKGLVGLGVETCIQLADVLGESRSSVLWACGYAAIAARLYAGSETEPRDRVRDALDQLAKGDRRLIESLVERLSSSPRPEKPVSPRAARTARAGKEEVRDGSDARCVCRLGRPRVEAHERP